MRTPYVWPLWFLFAAAVGTAWGFVTFGWMFSWYMKGQFAFLLLTAGLAAILLRTTRKTVGSLAAIAIGLLLANWGLLEILAMVTIWSIGGGFAP
jgi:hypothetical protein